MPDIKPLKGLVNRARRLREGHRARHRPTGFGFALADGVDYLDGARWDALTAPHSLFLSRPYLRVLEEAGPENMRQRYAMIFRGREAVAAVAGQCVTVSAARVRKATQRAKLAAPLERVRERLLVCGNLLSWGMHGVAFAPGEDPSALWPAVAEALYRLRRADKLSGDADLVMVKDISDEHAGAAEALSQFSYRALETDPDMVMEFPAGWRNYDDYLASLTSRYRKVARQIEKDVAAAGCVVEELRDVESRAAELHGLYMQTHLGARLRLVTLRPEFIPTLAARLGDALRCAVVRRDDQLLGFVTTVRDGEQAVGYYIGFDRAANAEFPVYFRLLQAVVADAIRLGCRRLSLGRTALEPKARLGARPAPMRVLIRHRIPALNVLVRGLLHTVSHDEAPQRNPFK
ncbi:MAG TPA: GNAT family N-acetyltransferase [Pyrinomonadaceae bacterium]|nr:GNAT family N-acetyltransferase [Pyrinomonadaceae bacterium]